MAERPEDLNLPNAVVARIIKEALPDGIAVSKDARAAMSKAASIFVLYATSCANNFAMQHKRKTISGNDVLEAMAEMDFERFVDPLQQALDGHKKGVAGKKAASEQRKKAKEAANASLEESKEDAMEAEEEEDGDTEGQTAAEDSAGGATAPEDVMTIDDDSEPEK